MRKYAKIPQELKEAHKWLSFGDRNDKALKRPYNPVTGKPARTNDPSTLASFADCEKAEKKARYCGLGYVFTGDYIVIDLDGMIDAGGDVLPVAAEIIEAVDSYTEVSQSGRGFHIIARHSGLILDGAHLKKDRLKLDAATLARFTRTKLDRKTGELVEKPPHVEMYGNSDRAQFIALTGKVWQGHDTIKDAPEALERVYKAFIAPEATQEQAATVEAVRTPYTKPQQAECGRLDVIKARMFRGKNRDRIAKLWSGDESGYGSPSEARAALLNDLIFYTDANPVLIDKLYRQSGIFDAKRWDEPRRGTTFGHTEIERLIARARRNGKEEKRPVTYSEYVRRIRHKAAEGR